MTKSPENSHTSSADSQKVHPSLYRTFKLATAIALIGWLFLLFYPLSIRVAPAVASTAVVLLCLLYAFLVFFARRWDGSSAKAKGNFFTLDGVLSILKSPRAALGAWIHILVFDLLVGLYIVLDASQNHLTHWYLVPILLLTMMFGPAGLLAYLVVRALANGNGSLSALATSIL